ncbi:fibronectin type III domain-containing protein [Acrocarpospora corrugata]|nr:fibronectin type III domain-containing protein [Acrocarpospora corrugata]
MTRLLSGLTAGVALIAAAVFATGSASAESNGGVRVMPLGDSITDGLTVPGGYRINLWQRVVSGGYTVDFVGSGFNGPASLGDHDHEGHSGWRIDQIDANIVNWLRTYTPRTMLLHIGTNDMFQNPSGAPARLATLIDRITTNAPNTELFVATIIPLSGADAAVRTFNAAIPGIVQTRASAGRRVHLVEMYSALTTADLADGVHPNAGGYNKMAAVWYNALQSVPGSLSNGTPSPSPTDTTPPTTPGAPSAANVTASAATISWGASTDPGGSGLAGYNLYREQGATDPQIGQSATNSVTLTGLTAGTQYQLYVRARDGAGNLSGNSTLVTFTTTTSGDTSPPTAPGALTASGTTTTGTNLSWTASSDNTGVTGYDILRAPGASGGAFTQADTATATSFSDTGLTAGTTYRYQVRARDAAGNLSPVSNTVQITTQTGGTTGTCTATPTVQTQWNSGYVIQPLTIANTGTATITGWTVTLTLPAGHTLTGSWNGTVTVSGQSVTIRNVGHNGTLAPGASTTSVGFQVSRPNGNTALPSGYTCA